MPIEVKNAAKVHRRCMISSSPLLEHPISFFVVLSHTPAVSHHQSHVVQRLHLHNRHAFVMLCARARARVCV